LAQCGEEHVVPKNEPSQGYLGVVVLLQVLVGGFDGVVEGLFLAPAPKLCFNQYSNQG
jgi:hypothetical protein